MRFKIVIMTLVLIAVAAAAFIFLRKGEKAPDAETAQVLNEEDENEAIEAPPSEPVNDDAPPAQERIDEVAQENNDAEEPLEKPAAELPAPKNPPVNDAMKDRVHSGIKRVYGDLYQSLELSPAQQEKMNSILAGRALQAMEMTMSLLKSDNLSADDRAKKLKELSAIKDDSNRAIKGVLGEEKYAKYEHYENTKNERQYIKSFAEKADKAGLKISPDVQNRLTEIIHEEQSKASPLGDLDPSQLTKEKLQKIMADREKNQEKILSRIKKELSAEQFEVFKNMNK